ncbi:MAG TPA: hypothetical protein VJY62_09585 [Bacteroidia bacterium]|nr:hypothetical protein [Bacteroidia bacterium]
MNIVKIKKIKKSDPTNTDFEIRCNVNELNETLDLAFNDKGSTPIILEEGEAIAVAINSKTTSTGTEYFIFDEPVLKGKTNIYQGSIDYDEFGDKENILEFCTGTLVIATVSSDENVVNRTGYIFTKIDTTDVDGTISFFKETESDVKKISLERASVDATTDQAFWDYIKEARLNFTDYRDFIDELMCSNLETKYNGLNTNETFSREAIRSNSAFIGTDSYNVVKFATEAYMLKSFGIDTSSFEGYLSNNRLPYYDKVINALNDFFSDDDCLNPLYDQENPFMIELIWNFWMEQGMLVETMKLISMRFRNFRGNHRVELLQRFDTDPLRPLSHILWGYTQDSQHRLLAEHRAHEYLHEYGLLTLGENMGRIRPVDSRSKFLEAFHNLLASAAIYFKESDDTTRIADAFPVLNNLKEVHLLLAEGNHNAYGNLTWTARHEMLMQQYILSRSEMREFLGGKVMVPYNEPWMDRVDTMRNVQQWGGTSITYFYELAVYGEQILLSIRLGDWSDIGLTSSHAANWSLAFRDSIQRYIHALRVVTGIDLGLEYAKPLTGRTIQPALLIQERSFPKPVEMPQRGYIPINRY